ncbi:MAG: glycosyltransferase family 2 protein [Gammaproteobacteria bacterium]|nr:glycosyltransferase family 2 protein [Gammaproteobacteria bacterium]
MYVPIKIKFIASLALGTGWFFLSTWLALPWIQDFSELVGPVIAVVVIFFLALLPGFLNFFILAAYLLDRRPKPKAVKAWPDISLLIAALNEENLIEDTIDSIMKQDYQGNMEIIVIDNGSSDKTWEILNHLKNEKLVLLQETKRGKSYALNKGIAFAKSDYIVTVDADTYLQRDALTQLVQRQLNAPSHTAAVAGSVYVKNSRESFMTRLQEWDYFHAIATIKRIQSLFQGTLVAQGAFSIYKKNLIQEVGGWPHIIGEDIVLTWALLEKGYRIDFAEDAISFTTVPTTYKGFFQQRSRWARGMLEAFRYHPKVLITPKLPIFFIYWDLFFPGLDLIYFVAFIPGAILACFGYYFIAGPMTLAVLPITLLLHTIFYIRQKKLFKKNNLKVRRNKFGFIMFILFYYAMMVPACLHGYSSELLRITGKWGTK